MFAVKIHREPLERNADVTTTILNEVISCVNSRTPIILFKPSCNEPEHPVGLRRRLAVGGQQKRHASGPRLAQEQAENLAARFGIHCAGGLIGKHYQGIGNEAPWPRPRAAARPR